MKESKPSCENCLWFDTGHTKCLDGHRHTWIDGEKACGDWKPKSYQDTSRIAQIGNQNLPTERALGGRRDTKSNPDSSAEEQKGDWLSEIKAKWSEAIYFVNSLDGKMNNRKDIDKMFSEIRKGHEADLDLLTDANAALYEQVRQLKADKERIVDTVNRYVLERMVWENNANELTGALEAERKISSAASQDLVILRSKLVKAEKELSAFKQRRDDELDDRAEEITKLEEELEACKKDGEEWKLAALNMHKTIEGMSQELDKLTDAELKIQLLIAEKGTVEKELADVKWNELELKKDLINSNSELSAANARIKLLESFVKKAAIETLDELKEKMKEGTK